MNFARRVPYLKIDPRCNKPFEKDGVVTVPAKMYRAAQTILIEMAGGDEAIEDIDIVASIIHRHSMVNKDDYHEKEIQENQCATCTTG